VWQRVRTARVAGRLFVYEKIDCPLAVEFRTKDSAFGCP
ncbi:MAG: hypothetical protein ACJA1R_002793, partial [Flavobacteriales bacterium]